jgi:basic amino acid/polyamine antiporter, APA family
LAELKRDIGIIGATFIAVNGVIGAGIFAMPQALSEGAGPASPYLILLFGAAMACVALVFGELAGRFDAAGGPVVYADAAFGRFAGFQMGWLYYLARVASTAANINVLVTYTATFAPGADQGALRVGLIVSVILVFVAINIAGVKNAVRTLNVVTVLKIAPLVVLTIWGLSAFASAIPAPQRPDNPDAFGELSLLLLYAFVGFELATVTAGETGNAKQAIPRALVATIAGAALFYFLIQLAYVAVMQGQTPDGAPLAAMAEKLAGPTGAALIAIAAIVSVSGNLFASMLATPRLTYAMAEEGALPAWFGKLHSRFATPANSIVVVGVIAGALAISGAFVWLAIMSALARMIIYLTCTAALVKLRRDAPQPVEGRRVLRWIAPAVAVGLCIWAGAQAEMNAWLVLAAFAAAGTLLYAVSRWRSGAGSPIYGAKNPKDT